MSGGLDLKAVLTSLHNRQLKIDLPGYLIILNPSGNRQLNVVKFCWGIKNRVQLILPSLTVSVTVIPKWKKRFRRLVTEVREEMQAYWEPGDKNPVICVLLSSFRWKERILAYRLPQLRLLIIGLAKQKIEYAIEIMYNPLKSPLIKGGAFHPLRVSPGYRGEIWKSRTWLFI